MLAGIEKQWLERPVGMDKMYKLYISTPEKVFFNGNVSSLVLTTTDGEVGILAGHPAMVVALPSSPIRMKTEEDWRICAISGGFASIKSDEVTVFADTAEWPEDIEESRAIEAKRRAEERLQARESEIEYMRSRVALERALVRLTVKNNYHM